MKFVSDARGRECQRDLPSSPAREFVSDVRGGSVYFHKLSTMRVISLLLLVLSIVVPAAQADAACPTLDVYCMAPLANATAAGWKPVAGCALNSTTALTAPAVTIGGQCYLTALVGTATYVQAGEKADELTVPLFDRCHSFEIYLSPSDHMSCPRGPRWPSLMP